MKTGILGLLLTITSLSMFAGNCTTAVDSAKFVVEKKKIEQHDFDDEKKKAASAYIAKTCFNTQQVIELIQLFSFEGDKLQFAKEAYKKVIDPQNYNKVYTVFSFDNSKEELKTYIQQNK